MPTSFDVLLKNWLTKISNSIKGISVSGDTLTVTKTDNSTEDLTLGLQALEKKIFAQSTWYKRPELPTPNKTTITIPAGTQVAINGTLYISTTPQELRLNTVINAETRKGKDMYIYACVPDSGTEPKFAISLNATVPTGYTADVSRKIGGFHCLCADVGTIADHPLSGYLAGDILPASVWDLLHRAVSENEGMVYVNGQWYDIYLNSVSNGKLCSMSGWSIQSGNFTGETFAIRAGAVQKSLMSRDEFLVVSQGSNQMTRVATLPSGAKKAGGHTDENGRRMISNYGLEECNGYYYQYTNDTWGAFNDTSTTFARQGGVGTTTQTTEADGDHILTGYLLQADGRGTTNRSVDGALNVQGLSIGGLVRANVGGFWGWSGERLGSRHVELHRLSSLAANGHGVRLKSLSRVVNL